MMSNIAELAKYLGPVSVLVCVLWRFRSAFRGYLHFGEWTEFIVHFDARRLRKHD